MIIGTKQKVLVLGATGMLGNAVHRLLSKSNELDVYGTTRSTSNSFSKKNEVNLKFVFNVDSTDFDSIIKVFSEIKPDIVINCIGLIKQLSQADDPLAAIPINSLLPHRLARLSNIADARFIHISTDCVFNGKRGMYTENDTPDAIDLYGKSKYLGEVTYPNTVTLRTSIIGHELNSTRSLVGWFLSQEGKVKGYKNAIFSGLPTVEVANIIKDHVIPNNELQGLYHLSSSPINKLELLQIIANVYNKNIQIESDDSIVIDRSLDSTKFRSLTGYQPASWPELVQKMFIFS